MYGGEGIREELSRHTKHRTVHLLHSNGIFSTTETGIRSGFVMLTDQEIELIAEKIVEKLRERLRRTTAE